MTPERIEQERNELHMKYELTDMVLETECGLVLHRIRALRDIPEHGITAGDLGGWIESESNLSQDYNAWVSGDAHVYGNACVYGDAHVYDDARVSGSACVYGDAHVTGNARVSGSACVYDNARVSGDARVTDRARVSGDARVFSRVCVYGNAHVYGDARLSGAAHVYDDARVFDLAHISGDACVSGDAHVYSNARVSGDARITGDARLPSRDSIFTASYVGTENGTLTVTSGVSGLVVTRGCFTGSVDEFLERSRAVHDDRTHDEYRMLIEVAKSRILVHAVPDTED